MSEFMMANLCINLKNFFITKMTWTDGLSFCLFFIYWNKF